MGPKLNLDNCSPPLNHMKFSLQFPKNISVMARIRFDGSARSGLFRHSWLTSVQQEQKLSCVSTLNLDVVKHAFMQIFSKMGEDFWAFICLLLQIQWLSYSSGNINRGIWNLEMEDIGFNICSLGQDFHFKMEKKRGTNVQK